MIEATKVVNTSTKEEFINKSYSRRTGLTFLYDELTRLYVMEKRIRDKVTNCYFQCFGIASTLYMLDFITEPEYDNLVECFLRMRDGYIDNHPACCYINSLLIDSLTEDEED